MNFKWQFILLGLMFLSLQGLKADDKPTWQCWGVYPDMPTPSMKYVNFGPLDPQFNALNQEDASVECNRAPLYLSCNGNCAAYPRDVTPKD
jgi:hypothetical protein